MYRSSFLLLFMLQLDTPLTIFHCKKWLIHDG